MKKVHALPKDEQEHVIKWPNSFYDRGVRKGKAEGAAQGKALGKAEGIAEAQKEMVLRMLQKQMEPRTISELTGLSIEEIIKLKE